MGRNANTNKDNSKGREKDWTVWTYQTEQKK